MGDCDAKKIWAVLIHCSCEELPCWWPSCLCHITAKSIMWSPFNTINYFGAYVWGRMSFWKMFPSWEMLSLSCADF